MTLKKPLSVLVPQRVRRVPSSFAWIDHRLRSDGFLERLEPADIGLYPASFPRIAGPSTVPDVHPVEKGSEEERNVASGLDADRGVGSETSPAHDDGEGSRIRSELARDLVHRVKQLVPMIGDVSLATHLQLLKRDLSQCHDMLRNHPSENNFLSIVTLVESAMAQLKWKQYDRACLQAIRGAFEIGYQQVTVGFEDYEKARGLFVREHVDAAPRIDLASLSWDDVAKPAVSSMTATAILECRKLYARPRTTA